MNLRRARTEASSESLSRMAESAGVGWDAGGVDPGSVLFSILRDLESGQALTEAGTLDIGSLGFFRIVLSTIAG